MVACVDYHVKGGNAALAVKLGRVPEEYRPLASRIQEYLVPRPNSTVVLVSDGYVSPEKADLLAVVDTSLKNDPSWPRNTAGTTSSSGGTVRGEARWASSAA